MSYICADACFVIALSDPRDGYHDRALQIYEEYLENSANVLFLPWPAIYEAVSTRAARNPTYLARLRANWNTLQSLGRLELLDDSPYRDQALDDSFINPSPSRRKPVHLSAADRVIRSMIADGSLRLDALISFNYSDFADVCAVRKCVVID
ncbi:hypothetical protein [Terriglobus saanensis]|uniref:PIN domain-containing protein n=1 Tax=Terriglobus saanensis (strain ATCC BAA-1853 / DSM 23119 / SP1PR4) TaxID=401053 RepID=E8UY19_TERSS|nr:hypothetical protein [Terriglobus saanensis]ADV84253.1 hypothetical protein AciPR4_3500 [Terriglobus saanensis SP1PR4]